MYKYHSSTTFRGSPVTLFPNLSLEYPDSSISHFSVGVIWIYHKNYFHFNPWLCSSVWKLKRKNVYYVLYIHTAHYSNNGRKNYWEASSENFAYGLTTGIWIWKWSKVRKVLGTWINTEFPRQSFPSFMSSKHY